MKRLGISADAGLNFSKPNIFIDRRPPIRTTSEQFKARLLKNAQKKSEEENDVDEQYKKYCDEHPDLLLEELRQK